VKSATFKAAARLARAAAGLEPPPGVRQGEREAPPAAEILSVLRANKVPLLTLAADGESSKSAEWLALAAAPETQAAIEEERRRKAELLASYRPVAGALESAGAPHVLFKSARGFPYLSSNLDVLVAPGRFREAAAALEDLGHIRIPHYREAHKLLFRTFDSGLPSLSVHLHEAVSWGPVLILEGAGVVERRAAGEDDGIHVASPQDALATVLLHSVIETDQVRLSDLLTAKWCLEHGAKVALLLAGAERDRYLAAAASALLVYDAAARRTGFGALLSRDELADTGWKLLRRPWAHAATGRALRRSANALPFELPKSYAKLVAAGTILGDDRKEAGRQFGDLGWSLWNLAANRFGWRCRPPSLVTISGPDGSGKSAIAQAVMDALKTCEVPARSVWNRGGFSPLAVAGKALVRRKAPRLVPPASSDAAKRIFLGSRRLRWLWAWWIAIEQAVSVQRVRFFLALGRTVVCDRYIYDSLADFIARVPRGVWGTIPRRPGSVLLGAARVPHLALFLDVGAETAYARKPDGTTFEARRNLVDAYGEVKDLVRFRHIDADRPFEEVREDAVSAALRSCMARFRGDGP